MPDDLRPEKVSVTCPQCGARSPQVMRSGEEYIFTCPECGARFRDDEATLLEETQGEARGRTDFAPGELLGGCRIDKELGRGGMGVVYRATQLSLDRTVALKVLAQEFSDQPHFLERFYQESKVLSELNHPNIVLIIDRGHEEETYYFLMEYVEGRRLDELINQTIDAKQFVDITTQICHALSYAHRRGVVHRDIKPSNIIVNNEGQVKVADFGLAGLARLERGEQQEDTFRPSVMGTPRYMSPEQREAPLSVDARSDIFSLGLVMYEMAAGAMPDIDRPVAPSLYNDRVDPRLDAVLLRCLQMAPEKRYQSAAELLEELDRFETELDRAPPCPHCGEWSPVRFKQCENCGESLEQLFDSCPDCGYENRLDVSECLKCGLDLHKRREELRAEVDELFREATALRDRQEYAGAVRALEHVLRIEGKTFEGSRSRARQMRRIVQGQRLEAAKRTYEEGKRLLGVRQINEAIAAWQSIDPGVLDVSDAIAHARRRLEKLANAERSKRITTIFLIVVAVIILFILVLLTRREAQKPPPTQTPARSARP